MVESLSLKIIYLMSMCGGALTNVLIDSGSSPESKVLMLMDSTIKNYLITKPKLCLSPAFWNLS